MDNQIVERSCVDIQDALRGDIVSVGEAFSYVKDIDPSVSITSGVFKDVLIHLLHSKVEVGNTFNPTGNYLEFVAWMGSVEERVVRLLKEIIGHKVWEFKAWLALPENIDRYKSAE